MSKPDVTIDVTSEGISATMWVVEGDQSIALDETWYPWAELLDENIRPGAWQTFNESIAPHMSGSMELRE